MREVLRTITHEDPLEDKGKSIQVIEDALATAAYAARSALHSTLVLSPGALVFNRDMSLDIPVIADWEALQGKQQHIIARNLRAANKGRITHHDYAVDDQTLKLTCRPDKLEPRAEGPHRIVRVHVNGTVTTQRTPLITERMNTWRIKPQWQPLPIAVES